MKNMKNVFKISIVAIFCIFILDLIFEEKYTYLDGTMPRSWWNGDK